MCSLEFVRVPVPVWPHTLVYTCSRRPEVDFGCLPQLFFTLVFETGSLTELGTDQFGRKNS